MQQEIELQDVAKAWIDMWSHDIASRESDKYDWVYDFESRATYEKPETGFRFILAVLELDSSPKILEVLSAGPLENLLANFGESIIERVETQARKDPNFAKLLGGVWQNSISEEVWSRVRKVWNRSGWDGNP